MKRLLITALLALSTTAGAYSIGGAYAQLVSCDYGQYGYQFGYIGTYRANGSLYRVFFGTSYCQH